MHPVFDVSLLKKAIGSADAEPFLPDGPALFIRGVATPNCGAETIEQVLLQGSGLDAQDST